MEPMRRPRRPGAGRLPRRGAPRDAAAWARSTARSTTARTARRAQGAHAPARRGRGLRDRLLRESRLAASLDHPNVDPDLRGRRGGRAAVHRDALRRRDRPEGAAAPRGRARARPRRRDLRPDRRRARRRPPPRPRAPRRQAEQRPARPRRAGASTAIWPTSASPRAPPTAGPPTGSSWAPSTTSRRSRSGATRSTGAPTSTALACLLFECLTGTVPLPAALRGRGAVRPPRGAGAAGQRARVGLPAALDDVFARAMAKEPEERFASCTDLVAAARGALGLDRPAARLGGCVVVALAARRRPRGCRRRGPCSLRGGGGAPAAVADRDARACRPADERGRARPRSMAGHRAARCHARRASGWPTSAPACSGAIEPGAADARAHHLERRAARPRRARRQDLRRSRRALSPAWSRATTPSPGSARTRSTCSPARWPRARASSGQPAAPTSAPQHRQRQAAQARRGLPALPPPATVENGRVQFRELAVGAGSRVGARRRARPPALAPRRARPGRIERDDLARLPADARSPSPAARPGSPTASTTGRAASTRPATGCCAGIPVGRGAAGVAQSAPGSVWVANALDGTLSRIDARVAAAWSRRSTSAARRARSRSAAGSVWVTEHAP